MIALQMERRAPALSSHRISESSDDYSDVVVLLNDRWRVIECRHGIQWIFQHRNRSETVSTGDWRGRSYCRTRQALRRCCDDHAGEIGPLARNILSALPERIIEGVQA